MKKLTTLEMECAIMNSFGVRQNIIVPNVSWGLWLGGKAMHECDLLVLSRSNYATEVEIKISKYDLFKDKEKRHNHDHKYITRLFFAVPFDLKEIALKEIPENAGLYTVEKIDYGYKVIPKVIMVRDASRRKNAVQWDDKDVYQLLRLGVMRILGLKEKLLK